MRWTWLTMFLALIIGGAFVVSAPAAALGSRGAPAGGFSSVYVVQRQPSPSDAPTGVTPAPTGTATPVESSPPVPGSPGTTGTGTGQQQSNDGVTPLVIGGGLLLVVLLIVIYLWRRRGRVRDL